MKRLKKLWIAPLLLLIACLALAAWDVPGPVEAFSLIQSGGGAGGAAATNYTADASILSYWMHEQATAGNATDGKGVNTLSKYSDGSGPDRSSTHIQGSYSSLLDSAGDSEAYLLADANLSSTFPGKSTTGHQGSITVGGWFTFVSTNSHLAEKYETFGLECDGDGYIKFWVTANGYSITTVTSTGTVTANGTTWYHVVGVFDTDDNEIRVYIDGEQDATPVAFTNALYRSAEQFVASKYHDGNIDECFVFTRALSDEEVLEIYTHGLAGER